MCSSLKFDSQDGQKKCGKVAYQLSETDEGAPWDGGGDFLGMG
jgi:hypothetical protein